jgi:ATP-dependent DNA helicase RecG
MGKETITVYIDTPESIDYTACMRLQTPLIEVLGTTRKHLDALKEMGIETVEDLLLYLPRAHEDASQIQTLLSVPLDQKAIVRGVVEQIKLVYTRSKKKLVTARFTDTEGQTAEVIWFNQPHIKRMLKDGDEVVLKGKITENRYKLQIMSPEFETALGQPLVHAGRLVPIYPQHDIINTKWLREKMVKVRDAIDLLPETLPEEIVEEEKLLSKVEAVQALHFPEDSVAVKSALERMAFEEMYKVQIHALSQKKEWQGTRQERLKIPMDTELIRAFFSSLHFTPTDSQKISIYEILKDMERDIPMSRLLEGDVGSGKTLVAIAVIANVLRHGGQCALMVPTEVLAKQHVQSIGKILLKFHKYLEKQNDGPKIPLPTVELLTGSVPKGEAQKVKQRLASGTVDLVIGTHALIVENVLFRDLKLVIVDEQHRFGVEQRRQLVDKGPPERTERSVRAGSPHFLSMTATPIPRTLALTAYGHHDLSVLTEKPGNRLPIHTKVVPPQDRRTVELFIDHEIETGRQVFVICPLITESEKEEMAEIKSVEAEVNRLKEGFPHRRIAPLHGKMSSEEKDETMRSFKERESDILVSTSVIEVGIDIPNATIMVIEGAERFGLSQLHQFRGRVGRSDHKSHCFLFSTSPQQAKSPRLRAMEQHDSGFALAEIDLRLRGPGELFGVRQSGIPELRVGSLLDPELVVRARRAAEKYLKMEKVC